MEVEKIRKLLAESAPKTVRRVLPRDYIANHIKYHLKGMQTMMQSFQAILTFPTGGRNLPELVMKKMHKQFREDIGESGSKIDEEVELLVNHLKSGHVLQSFIMLELLTKKAFPFCLLNDLTYSPIDNRGPTGRIHIPGYVILWAKQEAKDKPISLWIEFYPKDRKDYKRIPPNELKSDVKLIRVPSGQVDFFDFDTLISVILHGEPDEDEAFLSGKTLDEAQAELDKLRKALLRRDQKGEFLHIVWKTYKQEAPDIADAWV